MYSKLYYNKTLDDYELQEFPETDEEAQKSWGEEWYLEDECHSKSLFTQKITPELCQFIIASLRMASGWNQVDMPKNHMPESVEHIDTFDSSIENLITDFRCSWINRREETVNV